MDLPLYQVDAFTGELFGGNPAAVVPLDAWLDDGRLQAIAAENNLSETAFFVPEEGDYRLRWFTPLSEVDLCGHATLASAWVLLRLLEPGRGAVTFRTLSGLLQVRDEGERLSMDFPARPAVPCDAPRALVEGLGVDPEEILTAKRDYLVVYGSEETVRRLKPDIHRLRAIDKLGVIVTAPGATCDFVSRFFAPSLGVPEDPVTGSAHATLAPYWSGRLEKGGALHARQLSGRRGELLCEHRGDRVIIGGHCVLYLEGTIHL